MKKIKRIIANRRKHLTMLGIGVFLLAYLIKYIGAGEIFPALILIGIPYFLAAVIIEIMLVGIWNGKWWCIVNKLQKIKFRKLLPIFMSGLAVNNLTPGPRIGGEPVRAYYLSKKTGLSLFESLGTATLDVITHISMFGIFALFAMIYVLAYTEMAAFRGIVSVILGVSLVVLCWMVYGIVTRGAKKKTRKSISWLKRKFYETRLTNFITNRFANYDEFENYIHLQKKSFTETLEKYWKDKISLFVALGFSAGVHFLEIFKQYIVFKGLGIEISFIHVFVAVIVSVTIGLFIWMPGGTGVVEAVSIAMFINFGVSAPVAAAATLISRGLFYITTYGFGYAALSHLVLKYGKAATDNV